jgi:hypothetical protein
MIIAAAAWLPLLLAIIEMMVRKQEDKGAGPFVPIWYVLAGAVALGMVFWRAGSDTFAGAGLYALAGWRCCGSGCARRACGQARWRPVLAAGWALWWVWGWDWDRSN